MTNSDKHHQNDSTQIILAQLDEIASAVMYATEGRGLEEVLQRIAQVAKNLLNARYAALGVPDARNRSLRYFKVAGMTPDEVAQVGHLPVGRGLLGAIMRERKAIRLEHMADDSRSAGFCANHPLMTSFLGVPVQVGQQLFGMLYLCDRLDEQPFSQQDEWLLETIAGYAALAIAGSQLSEQQSRLTLLEERERIGMELHDGIIQSLYALGMHLDLLRMSDTPHQAELGEIIASLNTVIEDIRRYIMNLHSSDYRQKTIYERLQDMVSRLHTPETLRVELEAPHDKPLFTPAAFEAICQMANEAISNAVRHAEARTIRIRTAQENNLFKIIIEDDGKGFDPKELASHSGLGLRNIQQRAALHGGSVTVDTTPGRGTRLTIAIPVRML